MNFSSGFSANILHICTVTVGKRFFFHGGSLNYYGGGGGGGGEYGSRPQYICPSLYQRAYPVFSLLSLALLCTTHVGEHSAVQFEVSIF